MTKGATVSCVRGKTRASDGKRCLKRHARCDFGTLPKHLSPLKAIKRRARRRLTDTKNRPEGWRSISKIVSRRRSLLPFCNNVITRSIELLQIPNCLTRIMNRASTSLPIDNLHIYLNEISHFIFRVKTLTNISFKKIHLLIKESSL